MMLYSSLVYGCLLLYVNCLAISKDHHYVYSKHNKSFFFPKYRHEFFYDNKIIPEDTEVDVFLHKNQIQRLYYILEGGYRPISVTVTPCSTQSFLEWKLSHSLHPSAGPPQAYHSDPWSNHILRPSSSSSPTATYVGKERKSYTNPRAPPGLYTLELRTGDETRTRILVTTRSPSQIPYHPLLPTEPAVQIIKIKRNRILISWKASLSGRPLVYCVTSNTRHNYNSMCAAEADLYGAVSVLPLLSTGYAYSTTQKHTLDPTPKHSAGIACVGRKTWHMFKGLHKGKTYFFDVFVVDKETNATSAYVGVSASVKNVANSPSRLKDDSLVTFNLDAGNGYSATSKYHMNAHGPLLLFVQSCTGPGPITLTITQNGVPKHEILNTNVMDLKTLEVPRQMAAPHNGSSIYTFTVQSSTRHHRKARLWLSSKKHAFPFPVMPNDKSVSVFDTLTTCNSITIGWKTSRDERVKYCIYRQTAQDELMQRTLAVPENFCEPPIDGSTTRKTVLCRRYHRFSKRRFNDVIMQKVRDLEPGTTYLFEVQVTKVKGKMLPYEQVWATTHSSCTHHRNKR